jgi:hypothetical protein
MNLLFYKRPKNLLNPSFMTPNLTNGCTRQPSGIMYTISGSFSFHLFSRTLLISLLFFQLEIEVIKLFDATIFNFLLVVRDVLDTIYLPSFIQQWRLVVWDTCFF